MACSCGSKSKVAYQVKYKDGSTVTFSTVHEAQTAIRAAKGGSMKAVPKAA